MDLDQTIQAYNEQVQKIVRGGKVSNLNEFEDGRVTRNLLEQGHSPENIAQAIIKDSPVAFYRAHREELPVSPQYYADALIAKSQNVIKALEDIKGFEAAKLDGAKPDSLSEYRQLVKEHFDKNGITLNSKMDTDVAFKMLQRGHSRSDIADAILEASPVAQEAGRYPGEYSNFVMDKAVGNWEQYLERQKTLEATYSVTAKEFLDTKAAIQERTKTINSIAYQDGRAVRELMDKGRERDNLIKAVAENTPEKEGRTPEGYAKYIVNGVTNEIRAERNIRDFDANSIDKNAPPDLKQEYLQRAQKLFVRSSEESYNPFLDTRVATSLVKDGFDQEKIKEAIAELSPAGKRPGMSPEYPNKVFERVNERIGYEQGLEGKYNAVAVDYMRTAESVREANPGRPYSDYSDGQIAKQLLEKGHAKENVQKVISELSIVSQKLQQEKGLDSERYGRIIVNRTMESISRLESANSIQPKENPEIKAPTAAEEYQHHLKAYIAQGINPGSYADTQISKAMLTQGYAHDEIKNAIKEASPVAIEAGRNPENYSDYVRGRAEQSLAKEQFYKAEQVSFPRENVSEPGNGKSISTAAAYRAEVDKVVKGNGWTGPESDVKITQSLLTKGYDKGKIGVVIGKSSPEITGKSQDEAKKYSSEITKKAMTPEIKKQMSTSDPGGMKM